jgi:GNAT superfamily N-acetyltransferase
LIYFFKENHRRKGLGKEMMQKIKGRAIAIKCKTIQWQTPNFNKKAVAFCLKRGDKAKKKKKNLVILIFKILNSYMLGNI